MTVQLQHDWSNLHHVLELHYGIPRYNRHLCHSSRYSKLRLKPERSHLCLFMHIHYLFSVLFRHSHKYRLSVLCDQYTPRWCSGCKHPARSSNIGPVPVGLAESVTCSVNNSSQPLPISVAEYGFRAAAEDEKENVDDKGKKPMREEDLPQEQADGDEEAADSPGSRTDMELAWENLEVAKYIYEHEPQGNHAKELAGVGLLGYIMRSGACSMLLRETPTVVHEVLFATDPHLQRQ